MESRRHMDERRESPRFQAMDRALAMISQPPANMPYHIIDISRGGLAFRYLGDKLKENNIAKLDLYYNGTLHLQGLSVVTVADSWTGSDLTDIRRNCISFNGFTDEQQEQLELFIEQYTLPQTQ